MTEPGTHTYRGSSLDELLPRIREELGPNAVVVRQREGIVGGVAGFFGRRCVEVDARPGLEALHRTVPPGSVLDAYDTAEEIEPETAPAADEEDDQALLRALMQQASPFADQLADAEEQLDAAVAEPPAAPPAPRPFDWTSTAVRALVEAGVPRSVADAVVREAEARSRPFEGERLADHVRQALAARIPVKHGWTTRRRRVALVGAAGAGRSTTALRLCHAHSRHAGLSVALLSLQPPREAASTRLLDALPGMTLELASVPDAVRAVARSLSGHDLIVADTPAIDPGDPASVRRVAALVNAFRPQETHLVLPEGTSVQAARLLLLDLRAETTVNRILLSRAETPTSGRAGVAVAIATRTPVSYLSSGEAVEAGLRPADAGDLAGRLLA